MPDTLFVRGVRIVDEGAPEPREADLIVENGRYRRIAPGLEAPDGARIIDGAGRLLMPAMFDAHVHFRDPGGESKEDIASGSAAAVNGGVTGVVMMPNTTPPLDSGSVVKMVLDKAAEVSPIRVLASGCVTVGREGRQLAAIDAMRARGVKMLTDDGDSTGDPAVLYRAMEYAGEMGLFFASHCEVPELAGPRALNHGAVAYRLGIKGSPACAEEIIIDRDIRLAHATGAHIHIQHVSTRLGMETIRWWKERGDVRVTAEVTPPHLMFCDDDIGDYDTHYKMNPPLRRPDDQAGLLEGLKAGVFDLIATDHAPHTPFEKAQDFTVAPNGITGLETALISLFDRFVNPGEIGWDLVVKRYSAEPRRLMGLDPVPVAEGGVAEFLIFDESAETTFTAEFMKSKARNTPFLDQTLRGRIDCVVREGNVLKG
jgi:dihydroorotase